MRVYYSHFPLIRDKSLSDVDFLIEDIKNTISKLHPNEDNSDDMISIHMLKACIFYFSLLLLLY